MPSSAQAGYPKMPTKRRTNSQSTKRSNSNASTHIRRSGSTNTNASASILTTSYVATLRRQKATVWCERSQPEDTRLLAAQKAAKIKAAMEVIGSSTNGGHKGGNHGLGSGSSSSASLRAVGRAAQHKLGRGTNASSSAGIGANSVVNGPPQRLSATEATGDSTDEEDNLYMGESVGGLRRRSGSGRSSLNSNHRKANRSSAICSTTGPSPDLLSGAGDLQRRTSSSSQSPSRSSAELGESQQLPPLPRFKNTLSPPQLVNPHIFEEGTPGSREASRDYFESMQSPKTANLEALRRSGSVDERQVRTMTMSGLRLVVANPD